MSAVRRFAWMGGFCLLMSVAARAADPIILKNVSLDRPLVLNSNTDFRLENVTVVGLSDCAALTLAGRIQSVTIERSSFGRVWAGMEGKAAGIECAGAMVGSLKAAETTFFDAENQLATLREGSFGTVRFERCRFAASESFLKQLYTANPWRTWPPVTEFSNIDRLELLDNQYVNTTVIIHPTVKQVIIRGDLSGLRIINQQSTQVFRLEPGQVAESIAPPPDAGVAKAHEPVGPPQT